MTEKLNQGKIMQALDWAYNKAINGMPGIDTAEELANDYLDGDGTLTSKVNSLIRWQNTKSATSGFLTGLGGLMTMPVAIPANLASVLFVQLRMIAAIAYMGGHNVRNDRVKTLAFVCLCGNGATEILKGFGIKVGSKVAQAAINKVPGKVLIEINKRVGMRLVTKFGEKGAINLGKAVPVAGGFIGATVDAIATNMIGNVARNIFIKDDTL